MNSFLVAVFCAVLAATSASWIGHQGAHLVGPGTGGVILKGPAVQASLLGSDGAHIHAAAEAGEVLAGPLHGGAISAAIAPGHIGLAHGVPLLRHEVPVAPVVHGHVGRVGTVVDGPSGTIRTSGNANGAILATAEVGHHGLWHHG